MSFRQFGGLNYAAKHNIVSSNYNTSNNLLVTQNVGQSDSYINFLSDISASGHVTANEFYITGPIVDVSNSVVPKSYVDSLYGDIYTNLGQGLNTTSLNGKTYLNVDSSLNFINFLDNNVGPNAGTLNIGTNTTNNIIIGPTGTNVPIQTQTIIKAQKGITGSTGSFTYLNSSNNTYLATTNGTKVGIGTLTPQHTLDVSGNLNVSSINANGLINAPQGITGSTGSFTYLNSSNLNVSSINVNGLINAPQGITGATGSFTYLNSSNNTYLATTDGTKVGIGTLTPQYTLDVSGNINVSGIIQPSVGSDNNHGIIFPSNPGGGTYDLAWMKYYPRNDENCNLEIGIANDDDDHIYLNPSGNVGIKTSTPQYTLDVSGNLNLTGKLTQNGNSYLTTSQYAYQDYTYNTDLLELDISFDLLSDTTYLVNFNFNGNSGNSLFLGIYTDEVMSSPSPRLKTYDLDNNGKYCYAYATFRNFDIGDSKYIRGGSISVILVNGSNSAKVYFYIKSDDDGSGSYNCSCVKLS